MIKRYDLSHLRMLEKIAMSIQHDSMKYRHAALLAVKHKIISIGVNKEKSSPLQNEYKHSEHCIWTHAEVDCLNNTIVPRKSTLYVVRLSANNEFKISKPCKGCQNLIKDKKVDRVIYFNYNDIEEMIFN